MAIQTPCMTPDAIYHSEINPDEIGIRVQLPFPLDLTEEEAELLDILMHNQLELILTKFFMNKGR